MAVRSADRISGWLEESAVGLLELSGLDASCVQCARLSIWVLRMGRVSMTITVASTTAKSDALDGSGLYRGR